MPHRVGVLGAGVNGLSSAFRLAEAGHEVDIFADMLPHDASVPSQGAGGLWMPFPGVDTKKEEVEAHWSAESFHEFCRQFKGEGSLASLGKHVEFCTFFRFFETTAPELPSWAKFVPNKACVRILNDVPMLAAARPTDELLQLTLKRLPAGYRAAWTMQTPVAHAQPYLTGLLSLLTAHPKVRFHVGSDFHIETGEDLQKLGDFYRCSILLNAGGFDGARIAGEKVELYGGQGTVLQVDRPHGLNEAVMVHEGPLCRPDANLYPTYFIPRGPTLMTVGGTYFKTPAADVIRLRKDPKAQAKFAAEQTEHILTRVRELAPELQDCKVRATWTGWRPSRAAGIRLELEQLPSAGKLPVVHCYGHGGSGWTMMWGCAAEVVRVVAQVPVAKL